MLIEMIAKNLSVPPTYVSSIVVSASHHYKSYEIAKRDGGRRLIHQPSNQLKSIQKWLLRNVIGKLPMHPAAQAYQPGSTILQNASAHIESRFLLRMDFVDFFPSLTADDIRLYAGRMKANFAGWTTVDVDMLAKLVCRDGRLTIGAPTSPSLSNALCYFLDEALTSLSVKNGCVYTRYADDLFFSTTLPNVLKKVAEEVRDIAESIDLPEGLHINATKTRNSSKRGARRVTGITLGSDGKAYVPRKYKRLIRSLIHRLSSLDPVARVRLSGLIAFVIGLEPQTLNRLITKYGHATVTSALHPS
jgi:RNA-directed DNA polymerase